ncbi:MAG: cache domain-containing protein, partial [Desulfobulbaceae bacterium]|nr:cache domain-containing protein [Desulfobulbaceae bacterium]
MRKFFRGRIGAKVGAWFILIAVIPLASVTILTQKNIRTVIISDITAHLKDIIHEKIERIDLYVEEQQQSLGILANTPTVVNVFTQLQISQQGEGQKISGVVAEVDDEAGQFFQKALLQTGYYDIFLITLDGDIVYTLAEEEDLGTNLYTGPYRDSGLALVFSKAVSLLDSEISSFSYYPPSRKPAAFVATPVFGNGQLLGVIAAQLNEERLFYIFTDYLGLGESGELLAGRLREDGSLVAAGPLRHRPDALRDEFVLSGKTTLPIQLAVMGKKGAGLTHDYRGKPIIAAWDYVPSMDWGVVIKIDRDEAFAPIYRQTLIIAGVGLATLVLVLCGIFFATSSIIGPVKQLALVVQHFANGDFKARARKMRDDEVGILTDHFNDMADTIEQYTFTMEEEVAHRTQELAQAKDSLDRAQEIAHVGSWEWNITTGKLAWSDEIYRILVLS